MAQFRDFEWNSLLKSFQANRKFIGILGDGRYRGFNKLENISGLGFDLAHDPAGDAYIGVSITETADPASGASGIWVTKQGVTIRETASIALTLASNAANAFQRIDIIVGNHEYNESIIDGAAATYVVVAGATGGPVIPAIPDDKRQSILGYLYVPASAAAATNVVYVPFKTPGPGGKEIPFLNELNQYGHREEWKQVAEQDINLDVTLSHNTITDFSGNTIILNDSDENTLEILPQGQEGAIIFIEAADVITLVDETTSTPLAAVYEAGYAPIRLFDNTDYTMSVGEVVLLKFKGTGTNAGWYPIMSSSSFTELEQIISDIGDLLADTAAQQNEIDDLQLANRGVSFVYYRGTNNAALVGASGTQLEIPFSSIQSGSSSSQYSTGSREFTAPATGLYEILVKAEIECTNTVASSLHMGIKVRVAGTDYQLDKQFVDMNTETLVFLSGTLKIALTAGAVVTFWAFADNTMVAADYRIKVQGLHQGTLMQIHYLGS